MRKFINGLGSYVNLQENSPVSWELDKAYALGGIWYLVDAVDGNSLLKSWKCQTGASIWEAVLV